MPPKLDFGTDLSRAQIKTGRPGSRNKTVQNCPAGYIHRAGRICVKCGRMGERVGARDVK